MSRYIDANKLADWAKEFYPNDKQFVSAILNTPTAEVKEAVRGEWIPFHSKTAGNIQYCSACSIGSENRSDFCPHCGADMRYRGE